jgi:ABC-2 type transport system permease protein
MRENKLRSVWSIISLNGFLPMKRSPLFLVNTLTSPFSFLFFLFVVGGPSYLVYGVSGGMVLTTLSIGSSLQGDLTHYRTDLKFQEMVVATPVKAGTFVVGLALSELVYSIPGMVVFVILSFFYAHYILFGGLVVVATLILLWIFASALGFTLATYFADVRESFMVAPIVSIFLSVVPPVYYPISRLPQFLQYVAFFAPTTWAARLVQGAMGIAPLTAVDAVIDGAVLLASALILFLVAWKKAQWRET